MVYHICRIFSFSAVRPCKRHLAAVLLENDKILPYRPLMSFRSHPVTTTQRRFRLNFWDLGRIAVPLPSQTSCNGE